MLADFGAEVIKVERPVTGDELRNWRLYSGGTSMLYRTINRNKKSIVLDLKTDQGRGIASGFTQCGGMLRCAMATALSAHSSAIRARTFVVALPTCGSSTTLVRSASPGVSLGSCS